MLSRPEALDQPVVLKPATAMSFLSPAGMSLVRVCAPASAPATYSGWWQTASTLLPSGSRTKAPK